MSRDDIFHLDEEFLVGLSYTLPSLSKPKHQGCRDGAGVKSVMAFQRTSTGVGQLTNHPVTPVSSGESDALWPPWAATLACINTQRYKHTHDM